MKKVFLIFFALVVIFGISVIPCFAAGELVGQSNVVTVQLARPKLYYDPSYTSGARLSWDAVGSNGAVTLYYQSHQMYLRDEAAVAYTNANFTTNASYGFFELNSFAFDTYKTDGSAWIKFYITETVDGVTVQSNDIYVDVCTKQHIVDINGDGYDDSSYTAGYNSGSENYKGLILSLSGMTGSECFTSGTSCHITQERHRAFAQSANRPGTIWSNTGISQKRRLLSCTMDLPHFPCRQGARRKKSRFFMFPALNIPEKTI